MGIQSAQSRWARFWRQLIGVVVIYAVVLQSGFLGFPGVAPAANASTDESLSVFELCLNGHQSTPLAPGELPGHHGNTHCVFCFAGTHHAAVPPPLSMFRNVNAEIGNARWPLSNWRLSGFNEYSSAQPRGPPLGA